MDKQTSSAAPDSTKVNSHVHRKYCSYGTMHTFWISITTKLLNPAATSAVQTSQVHTATVLALLGTANQKPRIWGDVNLKFLDS
jgi:hypothetical protein